MVAPATTTAPAPTVVPAPSTAGPGASPPAALERAPSATGLPTTHPSCSRAPEPIRVPACRTTFPPMSTSSGSSTPSPTRRPGPRSDERSSALCDMRGLHEVALEPLEHPYDAQRGLAAGARLRAVPDALEEVPALDPQGLLVRYARRVGVPRARDVLAVRRVVLVEPLVVDGQLALELHVVERRHPLRAHHREPTLLVRVEPRQMHVRDQPRVEAHQSEHHVLHARLDVALALGVAVERLLVREAQDHRDIVRPQRPERILVRPVLAQVQAVRVDVAELAQLTGAHERLELLDPGVVLEQVPDHQDAPGRPSGLDHSLRLLLGPRERLLHEAVLAGRNRGQRQLGVRRDRR